MPLELNAWRIDSDLTPVEISHLDKENRLEDYLDRDIRIASPNWMVIGRQVLTDYGKFIDLLAIDRDGNLIILELKRDKTPRDVVAQLLDYGSWVRNLEDDDIARIFEQYLERYHPESGSQSLDDAFRKRFERSTLPDNLNTSHELVLVASTLDPSSERIIAYLAEEYSVRINAVFFQIFRDGDREYMTRAWFRDPVEAEAAPGAERAGRSEWNGEYYVSFGHDDRQRWEDAVKYGFVSAYGGRWYTKTLDLLEPGSRIWVKVPGHGFVGVGIVTQPSMDVSEFQPPLPGAAAGDHEDPEKRMRVVGVDWIKTVPLDEAISEKGFFGNQNTVCKPTVKSWPHTVERLKKRFAVE